MIKPHQIPRTAMVEACLAEYQNKSLSEIIAAAINAWPGAFPWTFNGPLDGTGYVLPVEDGDA